jgi:hypothetical protein
MAFLIKLTGDPLHYSFKAMREVTPASLRSTVVLLRPLSQNLAVRS